MKIEDNNPHMEAEIPVYLRVGTAPESEIGTITVSGESKESGWASIQAGLPGLLRYAADEIEGVDHGEDA